MSTIAPSKIAQARIVTATWYVVAAGTVDKHTGRPSLAGIRRAIRGMTGRGYAPATFHNALAAVIRAARKEADAVRKAIAQRAETEAFRVEYRKQAEALAASCRYDVDHLFRVVATPTDITTRERDLYHKAWEIAVARQDRARVASTDATPRDRLIRGLKGRIKTLRRPEDIRHHRELLKQARASVPDSPGVRLAAMLAAE